MTHLVVSLDDRQLLRGGGAIALLVVSWGLAFHVAVASWMDVGFLWILSEVLLVVAAAGASFALFWDAFVVTAAAPEPGEEPAWLDAAHVWRHEARVAMRDLSFAVDRQLARWTLSGPEREVAILLLQGADVPTIAGAMAEPDEVVEVRVASVLRKAEVPSAQDLQAFFFGGIRLPSDTGEAALDVPLTGVGG